MQEARPRQSIGARLARYLTGSVGRKGRLRPAAIKDASSSLLSSTGVNIALSDHLGNVHPSPGPVPGTRPGPAGSRAICSVSEQIWGGDRGDPVPTDGNRIHSARSPAGWAAASRCDLIAPRSRDALPPGAVALPARLWWQHPSHGRGVDHGLPDLLLDQASRPFPALATGVELHSHRRTSAPCCGRPRASRSCGSAQPFSRRNRACSRKPPLLMLEARRSVREM